MTAVADNWLLAVLIAIFAAPTIYGAIRSLRAELQDRARYREADRLWREVEGRRVHETYVTAQEARNHVR